VEKVGDNLGLGKSNPVLLEFQRRKALVDHPSSNKDGFTMRIDQATVDGYCGPTRFLTYNKNKKFQITGVTFYDDY